MAVRHLGDDPPAPQRDEHGNAVGGIRWTDLVALLGSTDLVALLGSHVGESPGEGFAM